MTKLYVTKLCGTKRCVTKFCVCVTKLGVKKLCDKVGLKDGVGQSCVCDKVVCAKDGV